MRLIPRVEKLEAGAPDNDAEVVTRIELHGPGDHHNGAFTSFVEGRWTPFEGRARR